MGAARDDVQASLREDSLAKQASSVRHLQALYTIVAGLALSDAIGWLFRDGRTDGTGLWEWVLLLLMLVAFIVTLIPFFHGALRHFDDVYLIEQQSRPVHRASLAFDFGFLFAESCLLFALAHHIDRTDIFLEFFVALLVVDIAWGVVFRWKLLETEGLRAALAVLVRSDHQNREVQVVWGRNNLLFLGIIGIVGFGALLGVNPPPLLDGLIVFILAVLRTYFDYKESWEFYFPSSD